MPIICKLCHVILKEPEIIIGESPIRHLQNRLQVIAEHFAQAVKHEQSNRQPSKPHLAANIETFKAINRMSQYLLVQYFELPPDMEAARERERHVIHAATRKVTMTDEELGELWSWSMEERHAGFQVLRDLRDRYEERGKYAPEEVGAGSKSSPAVAGSKGSPAQ